MSWRPTIGLEEVGMRKRKDLRAPSVSGDVEERIPTSAQVSTAVEEEEKRRFIKEGYTMCEGSPLER